MEEFDFETNKRYQLFEKALNGEDVTDLLRQFQEEGPDEDEYESRAAGRRWSARSAGNAGVWDWMDQEERWEAIEEAGYDPEDFD